MTELASVHRLTRASLKKQRAGASFKAIKIKIKIKLKLGFDEDFWFRWSIRQAVSETMIIMVDANHACDATAAISRPHTRLRSIASANDPMTYVLRAKSPLFARSREIDPPDRLGGGGKEIPPPSSWRVRPNDVRFLARNAAARAFGRTSRFKAP